MAQQPPQQPYNPQQPTEQPYNPQPAPPQAWETCDISFESVSRGQGVFVATATGPFGTNVIAKSLPFKHKSQNIGGNSIPAQEPEAMATLDTLIGSLSAQGWELIGQQQPYWFNRRLRRPTQATMVYAQPNPMQYAPTPAPQTVVIQQKSGGCVRFALIGVGIIVMLAIIGSFASRNGTGTTSSNNSGNNTSNSTINQPSSSLVRIGDKVTAGSWEITVEKVERSNGFDWSGLGNMQEPKGQYVFVFVTATNTSNKSASVNSFDYKLTDSTGAEFAACAELGCFTYPEQVDREGFSSQVPPRLSTRLLAIFDVAPGSKGLTLVVERNTKVALGDL